MTTMTHSRRPQRGQRRLDVASLLLLLVGLSSGCFSYWLVTAREVNVLVIVPSIVAATIGALHIRKQQAPRG